MSAAGKTFYSDYLQSIGWEMIDGDAEINSKNPATAAAFGESVYTVWDMRDGKEVDSMKKKRVLARYERMG